MHKFSRTMISPFLRGVPAGGGVYVSKKELHSPLVLLGTK